MVPEAATADTVDIDAAWVDKASQSVIGTTPLLNRRHLA